MALIVGVVAVVAIRVRVRIDLFRNELGLATLDNLFVIAQEFLRLLWNWRKLAFAASHNLGRRQAIVGCMRSVGQHKIPIAVLGEATANDKCFGDIPVSSQDSSNGNVPLKLFCATEQANNKQTASLAQMYVIVSACSMLGARTSYTGSG